MLYKSNQDLPAEVRNRFSEDCQDIYRAAFNSAIHWYGEPLRSHQVALSAVRMQSAMHKTGVL
jgi:cation transport regulator